VGVGGGHDEGLLDPAGAAGRHQDRRGALALDPERVERPVGGDGEGLGGRLQAQGNRPGGRFAQGADDGGEGVVGLAAGDLLLQDRGQQRLEDSPGPGDAQAGVVVVELADQPGGGEPVQRVPRPQQLRRRLKTPPGPRPPRRDPDPVAFRRVAGRGRSLRGPGRPPPAPAPVDQVGRVARPPAQRPKGQPQIDRQTRSDKGFKRKMRGGHRPDLGTPSRQPRPPGLWTTEGTSLAGWLPSRSGGPAVSRGGAGQGGTRARSGVRARVGGHGASGRGGRAGERRRGRWCGIRRRRPGGGRRRR